MITGDQDSWGSVGGRRGGGAMATHIVTAAALGPFPRPVEVSLSWGPGPPWTEDHAENIRIRACISGITAPDLSAS